MHNNHSPNEDVLVTIPTKLSFVAPWPAAFQSKRTCALVPHAVALAFLISMALFLISALVAIATATLIPGGNREPNGHSNANLYRGLNGQPKADYGENLRWVQDDIHEDRTLQMQKGINVFTETCPATRSSTSGYLSIHYGTSTKKQFSRTTMAISTSRETFDSLSSGLRVRAM